MPALLLHLSAVSRLAEGTDRLPPAFARAVTKDLEYVRFGAALLDLPYCEGPRGAWSPFVPFTRPPRWAVIFHRRSPVHFGLKLAQLVASGALVGPEAGRALVTGYFTHLALDRALHPFVDELARTQSRAGESPFVARQRIEWMQTLLYLREQHGKDLVGHKALEKTFQVLKHAGYPRRGVGGGFYELLRLSSMESAHQAPLKSTVDKWLRGLYWQGRLLSSPLGRLRGRPTPMNPGDQALCASDGQRFIRLISEGLEAARTLLAHVDEYMTRANFGTRARERMLAIFPEGMLGGYAEFPLPELPTVRARRRAGGAAEVGQL